MDNMDAPMEAVTQTLHYRENSAFTPISSSTGLGIYPGYRAQVGARMLSGLRWRSIACILLLCLIVFLPFKSFSQSCPTTPPTYVWYIAPGTGSPTSGSAAAICEGQVQYGDSDPRYVFAASTNCSAPLPTGSNQTIVVSVSFSPTPVGIADGLSYSYNSGTTLSTLASIVNNAGNIECPQYWTTAVPPILAETCSKNCVGDPINPGIGNVYTTEEDIQIAKPSTIAFQRFYNSADAMGVDAVLGWRHSYDRYINAVYQTASADYPGQSALVSPQYSTPAAACTSGFPTIQASVAAWTGATASFNDGVCVLSQNTITIGTLVIQSQLAGQAPTSPIEYDLIRDDGQTLRYTLQNGIINNPPGTSIRLAITGSGFTVTDDDDNVEIYNTAGVLQSITSRSGVVQTISYDSSGRFHGVLDSFGNSITVTRNAQSDIQTLTLNGGGSVSYAYDGANRLTTVTNLDGTTRSYVYGNGNFVNALTSIIDESGTTLSTWAYNGQEQATSTQEALGADAQTLSYNSNGSVTVTDALGAVRTLTYTRIGDINKVNSISGSQCPTCQEWAATT